MVKKTYVPERRDVVWVNLDPARGHEQACMRPALVLSPSAYNKKTGLMVACAITSQEKGYPFEVVLQMKKVTGVVLSDQIRSLDWKCRQVRFIEKVPQKLLEQLKDSIKDDPFPILPTAKLLAVAGLKGKKVGGAMVSQKHPNFIVNLDNATFRDVLDLIREVKSLIYKKYQIELEEEITVF